MKNFSDFIKRESDKCVKCGLCLPYCPTYQQTKHEGESPRGRIALLQNIANNTFKINATAEQYIQHCVACHACEAVCPTQVKYSELLIAGRSMLAQQETEKQNFYFKKSFAKIIKKTLLLILPKLYLFRKKYFFDYVIGKKSAKKSDIALLPVCISTFFGKTILTDTIKILHFLNIRFDILYPFSCCGGLHANAGDDEQYQRLTKDHQSLFAEYNTVLSIASGCTAVLQKNFKQVFSIEHYLCAYADKFKQYTQYTQYKKNLEKIKLTLLIHKPCTAENNLLDFIKINNNIKLIYLKNIHCCGASGTYFLEYPEMAKKLADPIMAEVKQVQPDIFVTQNIACAIHLKKQFTKNKLAIPVLHPVNLLASWLNL